MEGKEDGQQADISSDGKVSCIIILFNLTAINLVGALCSSNSSLTHCSFNGALDRFRVFFDGPSSFGPSCTSLLLIKASGKVKL